MQNMTFTLWDVGHGTSIWIQTPSGHHHVIDLGKKSDFSPSEHMYQNDDATEVDYLIVSHPDKDHIEDLPNFEYRFRGTRTLRRNKSLPYEEFYGSGELGYQKVMLDFHQRYIHPVEEAESPENPQFNGGVISRSFYLSYGKFPDGAKLEGNNTSIVTFILYQEILFVCPGDIEPKGWNELWRNHENEMKNIVEEGRIRFLVAPHHGRESGYSKEMMDFIQPHSVFISDEWGASRTHRNYYSDPLGIRMPNGEIKKYFSTKSKGRILCIVDQVGNIYFDQYDPERNRYHPYEIQP